MPVELPVPGRNTANVSGYMKFKYDRALGAMQALTKGFSA